MTSPATPTPEETAAEVKLLQRLLSEAKERHAEATGRTYPKTLYRVEFPSTSGMSPNAPPVLKELSYEDNPLLGLSSRYRAPNGRLAHYGLERAIGMDSPAKAWAIAVRTQKDDLASLDRRMATLRGKAAESQRLLDACLDAQRACGGDA